MDLDRIPVAAHRKQAVAFEILSKIFRNLILIQVISIDQKLRIISVLQHRLHSPLFRKILFSNSDDIPSDICHSAADIPPPAGVFGQVQIVLPSVLPVKSLP
jgi:hypothetical protein